MLSLPLAIVCSISIETIQLKYQLGFCQLNDVVVNSIEFIIGFLIFFVLYDLSIYIIFVSIFKENI